MTTVPMGAAVADAAAAVVVVAVAAKLPPVHLEKQHRAVALPTPLHHYPLHLHQLSKILVIFGWGTSVVVFKRTRNHSIRITKGDSNTHRAKVDSG